MFDEGLLSLARQVLEDARDKGLRLVTAESCTGGLIAGLLTEIPGSSEVVERGFVTYSNEAKEDLLDVPADLIRQYGAVSEPVAEAMAAGALKHSLAHLSVAVTGIAGPGGGTAQKPVGLVYIAAARSGHSPVVKEFRFGNIGRGEIRSRTVAESLILLRSLL
ncbi:MAG TPA: CinA family protein [Rhizomicrobium sp.]|jgi:nicotinamide-nucleotide amidase|nr:CinA family protein [Rhizomicrobium sp.]